MTGKPSAQELDALWAHHNAQWRDPMQVIGTIEDTTTDARILQFHVQGAWWEALAETGTTLIVSREYEHLLLAISVSRDGPYISYIKIPHPSGLAYDAQQRILHVAATRNPNQIVDFKAKTGTIPRLDIQDDMELDDRFLMPVRSRFFPGCLYLHDLAIIDGTLHANAVGMNAVVKLHEDSPYERVWWPQCIEHKGAPVFGQNHLQLNSIAAGKTLAQSFFSASTDRISRRRPGHKNFAVDKRGVIFSGETRAVIARGLTRPHSARLHEHRLWVDNSGYGQLGYIHDGQFDPIAALPGWTRGLSFHNNTAFVGTSRVIPRFRQYAPGLDVAQSLCGVHAVDLRSGKLLGSLIWPYGNQIFAIELIPGDVAIGFPFRANARRSTARERRLFYSFEIKDNTIDE